ncbi:MAG: MFS transporter [Erysipelotrichaceae bacterium]
MNEKKMSNNEMIRFSMGEVTRSLAENGIGTFVMLYFTSALGLSPAYAGLALSLSVAWDAITDPVMGYISDNTHSKYGRRYPYIFIGGILLLVLLYFYWHVPTFFTETQQSLFMYLVIVNILFKTLFTVYLVPYGAMAMDLVTDFDGRTKIQSMRQSINMLANFFGPGISWFIFFPRAEDVADVSKYEAMGNYFIIVATITLVITLLYLRTKIESTEQVDTTKKEKHSPKKVFLDYLNVVKNKYLIILFLFGLTVYVSSTLVANLQGYMYSYYMMFDGLHKTIANGSTMLAGAAGSAVGMYFAKRYSKKIAAAIAVCIGSFSAFILLFLLLTNMVEPGTSTGTIMFTLGNAGYWFGQIMSVPLIFSMLSDIAEVSYIETGMQQEGTFMSVYTFLSKCAQSFGSFACGIALTIVGFDVSTTAQSVDTLSKLSVATFGISPLIMLLGVFFIIMYPLSESKLVEVRRK